MCLWARALNRALVVRTNSQLTLPTAPSLSIAAGSTMPVLRTPDECFADLPLWPYEPSYFTSHLYGMEVRGRCVCRCLAVDARTHFEDQDGRCTLYTAVYTSTVRMCVHCSVQHWRPPRLVAPMCYSVARTACRVLKSVPCCPRRSARIRFASRTTTSATRRPRTRSFLLTGCRAGRAWERHLAALLRAFT